MRPVAQVSLFTQTTPIAAHLKPAYMKAGGPRNPYYPYDYPEQEPCYGGAGPSPLDYVEVRRHAENPGDPEAVFRVYHWVKVVGRLPDVEARTLDDLGPDFIRQLVASSRNLWSASPLPQFLLKPTTRGLLSVQEPAIFFGAWHVFEPTLEPGTRRSIAAPVVSLDVQRGDVLSMSKYHDLFDVVAGAMEGRLITQTIL